MCVKLCVLRYSQNLCESAFDFGKAVLKPGGIFLCKLWDGYGTQGSKQI